MVSEMIRVLYLYDREGWALHNVGLLWADLLEDSHHFEFCRLGAHRALKPWNYNYVLFGCTLMTERHLRIKSLLSRFGFYSDPWLPDRNRNFVSVVHDPCEVFSESPDWKSAPPFMRRLFHYKRLAVISNEMQGILSRHGIHCSKINTTSLFPLRPTDEISQAPLSVISRANPIARKNIGMFHRIKAQSIGAVDRFDGYFDWRVIPTADYQRLLDSYNCYLCTSWQEGGPLPLIDAIHRGCAVLTTPVGQTDEWVKHGENGFFCTTEQEFLERIRWFATHPKSLLAFRRRSLEIAARDIRRTIHQQLFDFLG